MNGQIMKNNPTVNVISRLSNQRLHTEMMIRSVTGQTYQNINHILGADVELDFMDKSKYIKLKLGELEYPQPYISTYPAPYNKHCEILAKEVKEGWICYMDFDDQYSREDSIETIVNHIKHENQLLIWKVQITPQFIVPSKSFAKEITAGDFSGIGFMFHTKHLPVKWSTWSYGDFRVAKQLEQRGLEVVWINQILSKTISGAHGGKPIKYE